MTPPTYILGVDLGGTNTVVGTCSLDGSRHLAMQQVPTQAALGADAVVDNIVDQLERCIATTCAETGITREQIAGVGIGAPGAVRVHSGVVGFAPNLGWTNFPLRDRIAERVRLPVTLDNDANCATLGEWWRGAAKGANHVIGITIGTGIGGGIVINGRIFHGAADSAGEIGHSTMDPTGRRCKCGNYGCLEAYASGPAIAERAREALVGGEASALPDMVGGDLARITARTVYDAAKAGDQLALEIVRATARLLGAGVANLLNIFNPDVVVLAGGVTLAGEALFEPMRAEVRRRAFKAAVDSCRIVPGELDGNAGVIGAVASFAQQRGLM